MIELNAHFHRDPSIRHSDWLRDQRWFIKAREKRQQEQRKEREEQLDNDLDAFTAAVTFASAAQINTFSATLDSYDTATIEALMENELQMTEVRERMDALLKRAYVMDDGRRVFKTEDGTQVFDEYGNEVARGELDPDLIDDSRPIWESYQPELEAYDGLKEERETILDYQDRLDDTRERINEDNITEAELAELESDLDEIMPDAVRLQLPDHSPTPAAGTTRTDLNSVISVVPSFAP